MSEHFIKNIEIKNFKCFEDFKAEGFGRVNLIGGKNNVGKTAFMEAVYILSTIIEEHGEVSILAHFVYFDIIREIYTTDTFEDFFNIFNKYNNSLIKSRNRDEYCKLEIKNKNSLDEKFFINEQDVGLRKEDINAKLYRSKVLEKNFIPSNNITDKLIISLYDEISEDRKRDELNEILNKFDKNIEEFDVIKNIPKVWLKSIHAFQNVSELGHGLKRYIAIISSILMNKDGFLFLDELENGIHYSHLDKLWEIILTISKQQNVQVFATTHSKECIESYARVSKKLQDKEITFIELCKREEEIKAFVYSYDWFIDEIEQEHEVRGCL